MKRMMKMSSKCKICGAPIKMMSPTLGMVTIAPSCSCGKIRKAIREEGCPNYDCASDKIDIEITPIGIKATCRDCKEEWYPDEYRE
jgi:hypothetical protein